MPRPTRLNADLPERLASNTQRLRAAQGLGQQALAEAADVEIRVLQRVESGASNPTLATLGRVATALAVDVRELLAPAPAPQKRGRGRPRKGSD